MLSAVPSLLVFILVAILNGMKTENVFLLVNIFAGRFVCHKKS